MKCPICHVNMNYDIKTDEYWCPKCGLIIENPNLINEPLKMEYSNFDFNYLKAIKKPYDYVHISTQLNQIIDFKIIINEFINANHLNAFKESFNYFIKHYYKLFLNQGRNVEVSAMYFLIFFDIMGIIPIELRDKIIKFANEIEIGKTTQTKMKKIYKTSQFIESD